MDLKAYEDFAAEPLSFPVGGRVYTISPIGIKAGLRLAGILTGRDQSLNDEPAETLWELVLGDVWVQMLADDCPAEAVARAGMAALADHQYGRATAVAMWETGDSPEALAARVAASKPSKSSASAGKTRSRASTSPTKSLPGIPRTARKATASRGKTSSRNGR